MGAPEKCVRYETLSEYGVPTWDGYTYTYACTHTYTHAHKHIFECNMLFQICLYVNYM